MRRLVAALAIGVLLSACAPSSGVRGQATSEAWALMAQSPLSARHGSVGAWTGSELVVVGGATSQPCPVGSTCDMPDPTGRRDGAAYDPAQDRWRTIAPSPVPIFEAPAAWSGTELVVLTRPATLTYDPQADSWETWEPPPYVEVNQTVHTDAGLLFVSYSSQGPEAVDWLFAGHEWQPLPRDPFGESYDRSIAWDGERHWLLSMAVENHFEAVRGASSRVAVLEAGEWTIVTNTTAKLGYGQRWWFAGGRFVAPPSYAGAGAYFDPVETRWTSVPTEDDRDCNLPLAGAGRHWVSGGGSVMLAADKNRVLDVPACPQLAIPDLAVWAGDELLVWGGVAPDSSNQSVGLRWRPSQP